MNRPTSPTSRNNSPPSEPMSLRCQSRRSADSRHETQNNSLVGCDRPVEPAGNQKLVPLEWCWSFLEDAQKGRSARPQRAKRRGVPLRYVEPLSDVRTMLADFFSILLKSLELAAPLPKRLGQFPRIPAFLRSALRSEIFPGVQFFMCQYTGQI